MGKVFESGVDKYIGWCTILPGELIVGVFEAFSGEPPAGGGFEKLLKVLFEGAKAAAGEIAKLFEREVVQKMLFHEVGQVYFTGFIESAEESFYLGVADVEDGKAFRDLYFGEFGR